MLLRWHRKDLKHLLWSCVILYITKHVVTRESQGPFLKDVPLGREASSESEAPFALALSSKQEACPSSFCRVDQPWQQWSPDGEEQRDAS